MKALRTGYSTGTCAAAAAKAAAMVLRGDDPPSRVSVRLPGDGSADLALEFARRNEAGAEAAVRKDAGDDPDDTDGLLICAAVARTCPPLHEQAGEGDVSFAAGEGVGTVTKPGLQLPPGEPAINPVPRRMIRQALREVMSDPVSVTVSIPGGEEIARKTFNPRLGIVGGLSILGTTGLVRPFSHEALRSALVCSLDVAGACGITHPVLVPGNIGRSAAESLFELAEDQIVEVSNEWGFMLDRVREGGFAGLLILGHPGKLAKLPAGHWDTHSSRSPSALDCILPAARKLLERTPPESNTVEGLFGELSPEEGKLLADLLAVRLREAACARAGLPTAAVLVNMAGQLLGSGGDLGPWKERP